jgi:hypothetical protein
MIEKSEAETRTKAHWSARSGIVCSGWKVKVTDDDRCLTDGV